MSLRKAIRLLPRRVPWLLACKVVFTLLFFVFATDITVTTTPLQAENGAFIMVSGNLTATDKGFSLATSTVSPVGNSCSSPIVFGTGTTANTNITVGHVVFDVQVNSTQNALASTPFNVTLTMNSFTYGPLCVKTPASPQNGQSIDCRFDIGTLPPSPYSYTIKVQ